MQYVYSGRVQFPEIQILDETMKEKQVWRWWRNRTCVAAPREDCSFPQYDFILKREKEFG